MDVQVAQTLRQTLPLNSITTNASITAADTGESSGRCLRALQPLAQNQITIQIPISHAIKGKTFPLLLTQLGTDITELPPTARQTPMSPMYQKVLVLLYASSCSTHDQAATAEQPSIFGLQEYVATLPKSFHHMPLYWQKTQVDRLGPLLAPTLHNFIQRMENECDRAYFDLQPIVDHLSSSGLYPRQTTEIWNLSFIKWAYCCLTSRTFDLTPAANGPQTPEEDDISTMEEHGLVPFMDLMNHASTPSEATLMVKVEEIDQVMYATARAIRDLKQDEELCFSYRSHGDALKFLFNYGFVPDDAKDIFYAMVEYPSEDSDEVDALLGAVLESLGLPATKTIAIPMTDENPLSELYVWALRVKEMHMDVEHREQCLQSFVSGQPLQLLNSHEENVWNTIGMNLSAAYEFYTNEEEQHKVNVTEEAEDKEEKDKETGEKGESSTCSGSGGEEEQFVQRTRDAAARILEKAMATFVSMTGGDS